MTVKQRTMLVGAIKSFVAGSTGVLIALNITDPQHFNVTTVGGWKQLGLAMLIAGAVAEARFLYQWATSGDTSASTTSKGAT